VKFNMTATYYALAQASNFRIALRFSGISTWVWMALTSSPTHKPADALFRPRAYEDLE
jgi:hypothetical protein